MSKFVFDLDRRLDFFALQQHGEDFPAILQAVKRHAPAALDRFYAKVAETPEAAAFFTSPEIMAHARQKQLAHWLGLFSQEIGEDYLASAETIGRVHSRIGLDASLYFGAYAQILGDLIEAVVAGSAVGRMPGARKLSRTIATLVKASLMDMDIAVTAIFQARADAQKDVITQLGHTLNSLSRGDFSVDVPRLPEDYAHLQHDFETMTDALRATLQSVAQATDRIDAAGREMSGASANLSLRTEHQAASIEETAAAIREVTQSVRQTADDVVRASRAVDEARSDALQGGCIVREAVTAMAALDESAARMVEIVGAIESIAFQTNLLSFNASIEAAHGDEHGKGFAVVADQVRGLATRSDDAAKRIKLLISESGRHIAAGSRLVAQAGEALDRIMERVGDVSTLVGQVAHNSEEQAGSIQQVNIAVAGLDTLTQQNAAMAEQASALTRGLADEAHQLSALVEQFEFGDAILRDRAHEAFAPNALNPVQKIAASPLLARNDAS
ncbi:globin-coupled sensor protein [Sphingomonas sp. C3-2]|uniref:methyl-accepting chemotaxis protein n=1 Tax=Sphingomonas sp. C3-2 TaxID=3062169 RepID=UPI00294B4FB7|nr:globin-coupled sensor protein [Sphingomonas sp. C3-2]WOK36095.1 globin-coupled sensor protein [Sphingomonas sp. C3-2]